MRRPEPMTFMRGLQFGYNEKYPNCVFAYNFGEIERMGLTEIRQLHRWCERYIEWRTGTKKEVKHD